MLEVDGDQVLFDDMSSNLPLARAIGVDEVRKAGYVVEGEKPGSDSLPTKDDWKARIKENGDYRYEVGDVIDYNGVKLVVNYVTGWVRPIWIMGLGERVAAKVHPLNVKPWIEADGNSDSGGRWCALQ